MLFNTVDFFLFLVVVLALFYILPLPLRKYLLLAASYFFYGTWNPRFLALLLTLTLIDYTAGIWIERFPPGRARKLVLIFSLAANLGFLGFFKYFHFLTGNAFHLDIVLPLGISFHTFQSMSYVVDVYRGEQLAVRNILDYALFICFFPQLVAGPIVRARDFFRDLWHWRSPDSQEISHGILLLALGLAKKMAFADQFAKVANAYFANPSASPGLLSAWSGVLAFGLQIYFDFSGYTDMAIGMAELLGFHFPLNFRRPYLARSVTDFWRRWHISLSTWLRDYLYIPLGGSRRGSWMTYRNLMLTMLLGGLWHGANWTFVIWGAWQGALLSLEKAFNIRRNPLTLPLMLIGWVFFRAADLSQARAILAQMFSATRGRLLLEPWHILLAGIALLFALIEEHTAWFDRLPKAPVWAYACALTAILFCLDLFAVTDTAIPFIYFQF